MQRIALLKACLCLYFWLQQLKLSALQILNLDDSKFRLSYKNEISGKAEVRSSFITTTVGEQNPRSHHKGATGRVRTGDRLHPVLCHCQLGHDIAAT